MTTAKTGTTMTANGVNFIDKDDTGRMLLGLLKHIAHTGGADTDKHLDEIRTRDCEKRDLGLTRNGPRQQGLTSTWQTHHQNTTRDFSTELLELGGITQKLDELGDFLFGLFNTGHIVECHLHLVFTQHTRTASAE